MYGLGSKIAVLGLLVAALAACSGGKERQAEYYSRAQAFYENGNFEKARVEVKNALQIDGNFPDGRFLMALLEEKGQNWQQMLANLNLVLELNPQHIPAHIKIAQLFYVNKMYDKVKEHVEAVLLLEPNNADAHMLKGSVLYREDSYEEAIREAHLALKEQPGHVGAISILSEAYKAQNPERALAIIGDGIEMQTHTSTLKLLKINVLETQGRIDEAVAVYHELIAEYPENFLYHYQLVRLFEKYNRIDDAELQLRDMIKARPDNVKLKLWLAQFIANRKDLTVAENALKAFLKRQPELIELSMALAKVYIAQKKIAQARDLYHQLIAADAKSANSQLARNRMVELELAEGNRAVAESVLAEIFNLEPENSEALITRARLALAENKTESAIPYLRTVVKNHSKPVTALLLLGRAHEMARAYELALDNYRQVITIDAHNVAALLGAAKIELAVNNLEAAELFLDSALDVSPENMEATSMLVEVYSKQGRWDDGQSKADLLLSKPASQALGYYLKGRLYLSQGQIVPAIDAFKKTLEIEPAVIDALVALSNALVKQGKQGDAIEYVKAHLQANPKHAHAYELLGSLYERQDSELAYATYREAIKINPGKVSVYIKLGNLYARHGESQSALAVYDEGLQVKPDAVALLLSAATHQQLDGALEQAVAFYKKILQLDPDAKIAINNLSMIYADYLDTPDNLQEALKLTRSLNGIRHPVFLDTLGWVNYKVGNYSSALSYLQSAIEAGGKSGELHFHLAKAYISVGKPELAKSELQIALNDAAGFDALEDARQLLREL